MITRIIVHQRNHESLLIVNSLVSLIRHDLSDLGIIGSNQDHPIQDNTHTRQHLSE